MKVAVLGTGMVGQAIAGRLDELAHDVAVGTRDVQATMAKKMDARGGQTFASWKDSHPEVRIESMADAARHGEMVINATNGAASLDALKAAGSAHLDGKVLLDVANPLDGSKGFPPVLSVMNTDSLAEQIQRAFPKTRVVKSLNTTNALVMVHPERVGGGDHTMFVSGDDEAAKVEVRHLLTQFGWKHILDLGPLSSARGQEMVLPLWLRLWGAVGSPMFNYKIVLEDKPTTRTATAAATTH